MSRSHANRGKGWEAVLRGQHMRYLREGSAHIRHHDRPVKVASRVDAKGTFRACFNGKGPVDFSGLVAGLGSVAFDAKQRAVARFAFAALEGDQAVDLEREHRMGGIAFIAARLADGDFVIPWAAIREAHARWLREGGRPASVVPDESWRMPAPGDWLPVVRALAEQREAA